MKFNVFDTYDDDECVSLSKKKTILSILQDPDNGNFRHVLTSQIVKF